MTTSKQNTSLQVVNNSGLTIKERQVIDELPPGLQIYVKAKDSPKVFEMPPVESETMIYNLIVETQVNIGHTKAVNDTEINLISSAAILNLIYQKYRTLTVAELKLAFLNGSVGDYGDYIGVNLKSASQWIKGYAGAEIKKKALHEWNLKLDKENTTEKTPEEKNRENLQSCVVYFDEFRNGSVRNFGGDLLLATYYDILLENDIVNFDEERRYSIYELAKEEIKTAPKTKQKNAIAQIVNRATKDNELNVVCKRIALHQFFRDLITKGAELSDLIKTK